MISKDPTRRPSCQGLLRRIESKTDILSQKVSQISTAAKGVTSDKTIDSLRPVRIKQSYF